MPHTLAQKILQAHTDEEVREAGQIVNCHLSGVLANDITGPLAIKSFRAMGAAKVFDKDRVFLVMDPAEGHRFRQSGDGDPQVRAGNGRHPLL